MPTTAEPTPAKAPLLATHALPRHVPALDGLRGIAILLVMFMHFTHQVHSENAAASFVLRILSWGGLGVDLFFVLSGFLITGILLDAKGKPGYFKNFYARRTLRIFPLYYGFVAIVVVALPLILGKLGVGDLQTTYSRKWWLITYTSNIYDTIHNEFISALCGHFWSLSVEEQFYIVWPFVMLLVPIRKLTLLCLSLLGVAIISRILLAAYGFELGARLFPTCRMDGMLMGAWLAGKLRLPYNLNRMHALANWGTGISFMALLAALWFLGDYAFTSGSFYTIPFAAFFFGFLLLKSVLPLHVNPASSLLSASPLTFFGKYSYGLYVFHVPLLNTLWKYHIDTRLNERLHLAGDTLFVIICFAPSIAVAFLSYHLYEKRFLRLKKKFA